MGDTLESLRRYRAFLESIPLAKYRNELKDVKWVEVDLYRELLPQASIYRNYWDRENFLSFEDWFEEFWQELHTNERSAQALKTFKKYYYNLENDGWFELGFKARMYRTWVPVLTQLDFCYMLRCVLDKQGSNLSLEVNARLDVKKGIDVRVGSVNFDVGKISQRKEARGTTRRNIVPIRYPVYNVKEIERLSKSPRARPENRRKYRGMLQAFYKYFVSLTNGFVVFHEYYVTEVANNLNNIDNLRARIKALVLELSGE